MCLKYSHFWLNLQRNYDEYLAREERKELLSHQPVGEVSFSAVIIKKGCYCKIRPLEVKTADLLAFFSISSHTAWEDYYLKQQLKVAFRISLLIPKSHMPFLLCCVKATLKLQDYLPKNTVIKTLKGIA